MMLNIFFLWITIGIAYADVAPPAHQPKIEIPGASARGTSFGANEFYAAAGVKSTYPLPDCFTNESGFMCCNADLLDEMHKAYDELRSSRGADWISCNIQAIANRVQKRAQARFGLPFEVLVGIADFASKARFYHNYICKLEREGRIILAYATPKTPGEITNLGKTGIPGVAGKPELPSGGATTGGAGGASGSGAGKLAGPAGGAGGALGGGAGGVAGAGRAGAGAGAQSGGAGASAGVGGFGASAGGGGGTGGSAARTTATGAGGAAAATASEPSNQVGKPYRLGKVIAKR